MIMNLFQAREARTPEELGYETSPEIDYLKQVALSDQTLSEDDARAFADNLLFSMGRGNTDPYTAMSMYMANVKPGEAYTSQGFQDILNYQMGDVDAKNVIRSSFPSIMSRDPSDEEVDYLFTAAGSKGVLNDPNELSNFVSQYTAMTPEGRRKDMTPYYTNQSRYGPTVTDNEGNYKGQDIFLGDAEMYENAKDIYKTSQNLAKNTLARMGATGRFA